MKRDAYNWWALSKNGAWPILALVNLQRDLGCSFDTRFDAGAFEQAWAIEQGLVDAPSFISDADLVDWFRLEASNLQLRLRAEQNKSSRFCEDAAQREMDCFAMKQDLDNLTNQIKSMRDALWAAVDVIPRWTQVQVPNPQGLQLACVYCKGHNGGALGMAHNDTCIVGRAMSLCEESLKMTAYVFDSIK